MDNVHELVAQIHNEFDTASDQFLEDVKGIINKNLQPSQQVKKLISLGFHASKPVIEYNELKKQQQLAGIVKDCVQAYAVAYPGYKFITDNDVERICKKYNLVCADSSFYIGDIPEKNIQEIEEFASKHKRASNYQQFPSGAGIMFDTLAQAFNVLNEQSRMSRGGFSSGMIAERAWFDEASQEKYNAAKPFKICAPQSDFDTTFLSFHGHMLEPTTVPDPVVLQPVSEGFLIITKWGLEANDPSLVNEMMN